MQCQGTGKWFPDSSNKKNYGRKERHESGRALAIGDSIVPVETGWSRWFTWTVYFIVPLCPNFYFRCENFQSKSWRGQRCLLFCPLNRSSGDAPLFSAVGKDLYELQRSRLYGVEHLALGIGSAGSGRQGRLGACVRPSQWAAFQDLSVRL